MQIVKGSIQDVSAHGDTAIAILNARAVILCDRSSSMNESAFGGNARYQLEDTVVERLQKKYSGQIVLVAFGDQSMLCPDGRLPQPRGTTNMLDALQTAESLADAGLRIILLSDGEPSNNEGEIIDYAQRFIGNLDTIFIGEEDSPGHVFMKRLATTVNGSATFCDLDTGTELLEGAIEMLLLGEGK